MPRISVETEYDKVIDTLSISKATCIWKLRKGVCHESNCEDCAIYLQQDEVYNALAVADKLAVNNKTLFYASKMTASIRKKEKEYGDNITLLLRVVAICVLLLLIFL